MKSSFIVSIHAIEKHLDARNVHASAFFSQHVMYESIKNCLNRPDVVKQYGTRGVIVLRHVLTRIYWVHNGLLIWKHPLKPPLCLVHEQKIFYLSKHDQFEPVLLIL